MWWPRRRRADDFRDEIRSASCRRLSGHRARLYTRSGPTNARGARPIESELRGIDQGQPVSDVRTMEDAIAVSVPRFNVGLLGGFALIALVLPGVGVYGVTSYSVSRRTPEIGVRLALGAQPHEVRMMILRESLSVGGVSVAIGIVAALALTRAMGGVLYGVGPTDVVAYASALLLLVALVASFVPARRATQIDPIVALRTE